MTNLFIRYFSVFWLVIFMTVTVVIGETLPQRTELVIETGHIGDSVECTTFSYKNDLLASGSENGVTIIWDLATGNELGELAASCPLKFLRSGHLAIAKEGQTIIWDLGHGREVNSFAGILAAVSHDESFIATETNRSDDDAPNAKTRLLVSNLATGQPVKMLNAASPAMFHRDEGKILSAGLGKTTELWDIFTGNVLQSLPFAPELFSPDGTIVLSTQSNDPRYRSTFGVWDVTSGKRISPPNGYEWSTLDFFIDPETIVYTNDEGELVFWDVDSSIDKAVFKVDEGVSSFSADGTLFATVSPGKWGHSITVWDCAARQNINEKAKFRSRALASSYFYIDADEELVFWGGSSDRPQLQKDEESERESLFAVYSANSGLELARGIGKVDAVFDGNLVLSSASSSQVFNWTRNGVLKPLNGRFVASSADKKTIFTTKVSREKEVFAFSNKFTAWNFATCLQIMSYRGSFPYISGDGKVILTSVGKNTIKILDFFTGNTIRSIVSKMSFNSPPELALSGNKELVAAAGDGTVRMWSAITADELWSSKEEDGGISNLRFSDDGNTLISYGGWAAASFKIWEAKSGKLIADLGIGRAISDDARLAALINDEEKIEVWDLMNRKKRWTLGTCGETTSLPCDARFAAGGLVLTTCSNTTRLCKSWNTKTGELLTTLFPLDEGGWVVTTPDGRFDTNKSIDDIKGLHWTVNGEILKPVALEVFMRQYYEPGLLPRYLKCRVSGTCNITFKPLPSIAEINRVQSRISGAKVVPRADGNVDVVVEVESVSADVTVDANDHSKKLRVTSGAYDLRLFRDGQLVGTSAAQERLQEYLDKAPVEVAKDQEAYKRDPKNSSVLLNTNEDKLWQAANVIISNTDAKEQPSGTVCVVGKETPTKATCTFKNIKLPRDGRKEIEFTAYAFNADRVKSDTAKFTYQIPATVSAKPQAGRAYLVSIGVNASENPKYNLLYAVNDALEMQRIVGEKLTAEQKYSSVVPVSLVSDVSSDPNVPAPNFAQKAIIRGVFSLLEGHSIDEVTAELAKIDPKLVATFRAIPKIGEVRAVEPEDTLIITFSGHGYADQAGIFYLLPYDIGKDTIALNPKALKQTISSDELSLWMREITATEMVMVIDACHSSAAVQGDGFKPGPMGSRGLGQLSYDKGMKILSATQADNVALELRSLKQGLLSYALLQDGVRSGHADANKNGELTTTEWLSYAEKRVPLLYDEIKSGKHKVTRDGQPVTDGASRAELVGGDDKQKSNLNLQRPSLFDFKKRNANRSIFMLR